MKILRFSGGMLLALLVAACGTTVTYRPSQVSQEPRTPRATDSVEVYVTRRPERAFVALGVIEARQGNSLAPDDRAEVLAQLRQRAAKEGCDAILLGAGDATELDFMSGQGPLPRVNTLAGYRAVCISYRVGEPECPPGTLRH